MSFSIEEMGQTSRARAEAAMQTRPLFDLEALIETLPPTRAFAARLSPQAGPRPRIIAGIQRSTPLAGMPTQAYRPRQIAMGYARVGAAALSVATEPDQSGGDLDHITEARPAHLPILRNDFLVTPYQIAQTRVVGADAVLLIARLLPGSALGIMIAAAKRYGVEALVEVSDEADLARAVNARTMLLAVNNDEAGLTGPDVDRGIRLMGRFPEGVVKVARGGIRGRPDIDRLLEAGFDALLIEGQLTVAADPADALWALMQPAT